MKTLTVYALEMLVCSGILLAAYAVLLEGRVKFRWCRLYLLLSTALAALIPLLRIPVWPGEVIVATPVVAMPELPDLPEWNAEVLTEAAPAVTPEHFCLAIYLLGAALIVGVMLWQVFRIMHLRRGADMTRAGRYRLVRTPQQIASFSFFRTIYVWDKTPEEEMEAVIAHESSHIAHRHSVERILMELLKAALWWNPFVWIAARRLTETEEFEADSDVLDSGYDRAVYMQTIFRQLFGYSPEIANGLRNSLTKKRFKMMTTQTTNRHNLLRLAGTLPALIGLLCAFSFTSRAAVIVAPPSGPATAAQPEPTVTLEQPTATTEPEPATATEQQPATATEQQPATATEQQPATGADKKAKTCNVSIDVLNAKGAVQGAAVQVIGSTQGVVTDAEGHARITVPGGSKLMISYPGCEAVILDTGDNPEMAFSTHLASAAEQPAKVGETATDTKVHVLVNKQSRPLPGALVTVRGTNKGTVTDAAGYAALDVRPESELEVSHIGCETQVLKVTKWPQETFTVSLRGDAPQIAGTPTDGKLLFIVNGFEADADFVNSLKPNQFETISILKDSASTALYGDKGRNGVVFITLKGLKEPAPAAPGRKSMSASLSVQDGKIVRTTTYSVSEAVEAPKPDDDDQPFLISETMPAFPVGDASPEQQYGDVSAFRMWVQQQVKYPAEALAKGIDGRVILSFIVERDGSVSTVEPLEYPDESLWEAARRVVATSPKWKPGEQRGEKVRVKYTLPVDFRPGTKKPAAPKAANPGEEPLLRVEAMPLFEGGGLDNFRQWVMEHVKYPVEALENNLYGMVVVSFVIEKDGSISTLRTLQSPGKPLTDEVLRVIRSSPKWTPGTQQGKAVRVRHTLPVSFAVSTAGETLREKSSEKPEGSVGEVTVVGYGTQKK